MESQIKEEPDAKETKAWVESHLQELEEVADRTVAKEGYSYQSRKIRVFCS